MDPGAYKHKGDSGRDYVEKFEQVGEHVPMDHPHCSNRYFKYPSYYSIKKLTYKNWEALLKYMKIVKPN